MLWPVAPPQTDASSRPVPIVRQANITLRRLGVGDGWPKGNYRTMTYIAIRTCLRQISVGGTTTYCSSMP